MGSDRPGTFPFTRGIYPEMYRKRLWTMRQYAGFTSAEASNKRYRYLLEQGVTGLSVAFDLPTQIGYDSDHSLAEGEVGRVGVPISTLDDMRRLFQDIPLNSVSTSMTINATAAILLSMYIVVAEEQNVPRNQLRGTVQNDILKEYIARGTYIYPPDPSMRLVTDMFDFCAREIPHWNTISISGYHIREAGSTAAQELAFTLANGIAYVEAALTRGLDGNVFGRQLSFFFNAHNGFLTEIAKFRAARRLWASIMKERFGITDEKALQCSAASMSRPADRRSRLSKLTIMLSEQQSRRCPPFWAAPSHCIRAAGMKRWLCQQMNRSGWPCAPNKLLPMNRVFPIIRTPSVEVLSWKK